MLVERLRPLRRIRETFAVHRGVVLLGPRQCGKTTLARAFMAAEPDHTYFDLERAVDRRSLEAAETALAPLTGLVVIDEIQRMPNLFTTLRPLMDRPESGTRWLLLGSVSPSLVRGVSESLAGRVGFVDLAGFDLDDVCQSPSEWRTLWLRGGLPPSYLAPSDAGSARWRENQVRTFLERDVPQLGFNISAVALRRFWEMVAHYHGQIWNAAEFARSMGSNETTARRYLDLLAGASMVRILPAWYENLKKRQVRAPRIYVRDSGILHSLIEVTTSRTLAGHTRLGASFEGFVIEQVLSCLDTRSACFWRSHSGAELDLLVIRGGRRYGFEFKYADAPRSTKSMRVALADLRLEHLWVVYPGDVPYELDRRLSVVPVHGLPELLSGDWPKG
ncbi:MAG: ATP-binding protein [Acidobacteria bacterium]|nr:ATP-binding protein [Acidobacteriota bacterium]